MAARYNSLFGSLRRRKRAILRKAKEGRSRKRNYELEGERLLDVRGYEQSRGRAPTNLEIGVGVKP